MNAAGERLTAMAGSRAGGIAFHDLDWDLALSLAENLCRYPGGQSAISFLDAGLLARCLVSPADREALGRHLVLPAGSFLSNLAFRMMGARKTGHRFSAQTFVPALLTYADRPMKVAVLHDDPVQATRLCGHLQRHTPWHELVLATDEGQEYCELMIVSGRGTASPRMICRNMPALRCNLTIFAGTGLLRLHD